MLILVFGSLFLLSGSLLLLLPLMLIELSRPRDWLMGGLFLFLGLFLVEENDVLRGSINLLVISMGILLGKMMLEMKRNLLKRLMPFTQRCIRICTTHKKERDLGLIT